MQKELTAEQKLLFTERKQYTDFFNKNKQACLLGLKGTGKTLILKDYARQKNGIYIDISRISISPENFAVEYIGTILHSISQEPAEKYTDYLSMEFLSKNAIQKLGANSKEIIRKVENELQKIKPDQALLLRLAFSFPDALAKETSKKFVIVIDEFQELLALNNYSHIADVLPIFFDEIKKQGTEYKLAGSSVNLLKKALDKKIAVTELKSFDEKETKEFCKRLDKALGLNISDADVKQIHSYADGNPLVIEALCRRYASEKKLKNLFLTELAYTKSSTYSHLHILYMNSLNNARGATLLKNLLKVMSQNPDLRLTQLAKKIYRSSPVTKALLERLIEVDLIVKEGNVFRFTSPLLKQWCALMFANIDYSQVPGQKELELLSKLVFEKEVVHEGKSP